MEHRRRMGLERQMLMSRHQVSFLALVVLACLVAREGWSQADPFWLESWNEAQRTRPSQMSSSGRIAGEAEPGAPLLVLGQIVQPDGRTPAKGVVVHAYHRDQHGFDFGAKDRELPTWRLQGWVETDDRGRFEFRTIRPAPDHMGRDGPHIHFTLESPMFGRQWAPTVHFADDAMLTEKFRARSAAAGEFGWVRDVAVDDDIQRITVKFRLKDKADF